MNLKPEFIEMINRLATLPGGEALLHLPETLAETEPSVAIRLNRRKQPLAEPRFGNPRRVPWAQNGFYIDGPRPRFTMDPAIHQGRYYVQDPSSMVIGEIVGQCAAQLGNHPLLLIDACAAPGGKTTAAIDALPDNSLVIANEFDRRRCDTLCENLTKWGYPNILVSRGDTAAYRKLPEIADIITVDAPCSGEGMMRKEEIAASQWSPQLVDSCAALQREILQNLWPALRPGGFLIYSTCTFNPSENESNLKFLVDQLGAIPVTANLPLSSGIQPAIGSSLPAYRFIPGVIEGEGLFVAILRKPGDYVPATAEPANPRPVSPFSQLLSNPDDYIIETTGDTITAIPRRWQPLISRLRLLLDVPLCGIELATLPTPTKTAKTAKSKRPTPSTPSLAEAIPSQALALSTALNPSAFPTEEVDYPTAMAYLRGEGVRLQTSERAYILLTFENRPLGFVKNLGNRANNLYPKPFRVKSTHILPAPPSFQ